MNNTDQLIAYYGLSNSLTEQQRNDLNKILGAAGKAALEVGMDYLEKERARLGLPPLNPSQGEVPWGGETDAQRAQRELEEQQARNRMLLIGMYVLGGLLLVVAGILVVIQNNKKKSLRNGAK